MPRESQYVDSYLAVTASRPLTPGTFLTGVLKGRAKSYSGRYQGALLRALARRGAIPVRSVRGSTAYVAPEAR